MAQEKDTINGIAVRGFKSICDEQHIEIAPLTILAGANSSGKSSLMQPLLLLKQTLEAPGDPGALLLDGPNVRFTSAEQLRCKGLGAAGDAGFSIRLEKSGGPSLEVHFEVLAGQGLDVTRMLYVSSGERLEMVPGMSEEAVVAALPKNIVKMVDNLKKSEKSPTHWRVSRNRCFLAFELAVEDRPQQPLGFWPSGGMSPSMAFVNTIQSTIHLPGLRGNARRTYPKTAVGRHFPGTFDAYTASLISKWQAEKSENIADLGRDLQELGLTWKVAAKAVDDTQVELLVGRLSHSRRGGAHDMVSIADVGIGVSQSLPVLVALLAARPGQLVYLEQPEIHLHPKAQRKLAHLLCRAAKRGIILVIETHSALLLREVQTLVATGEMPKDDVRLHWVQRNERGATIVTTATPDENGAYGKWPQDFDTTELESEQGYLDAVEMKGAAE